MGKRLNAMILLATFYMSRKVCIALVFEYLKFVRICVKIIGICFYFLYCLGFRFVRMCDENIGTWLNFLYSLVNIFVLFLPFN